MHVMKRKSNRTSPPSPAAPPPSVETAAAAEPAAREPINVRPDIKGRLAEMMLAPEMAAAQVMRQMMDHCMTEAGIDLLTVAGVLTTQGDTAAHGDLAQARRTLSAQIAMLDRTCLYLMNCAMVAQKHSQDLFERYMRLALKAQAQSAQATAVLGRLSPKAARPAKPEETQPQADGVSKTAPRRPAPVSTVPFRRSMSLKHRLRPAGTGRIHGLSAPKG